MTTSRFFQPSRTVTALATSVAALLVAGIVVHAGTAAATADGCSGAYGWPVAAFDRPHQIRGAFGDPRTQFSGPPTRDTLLEGAGKFTFHEGVDITAPDGTKVYPVASGTVTSVTREWVGVTCGNGRAFEYWHIDSRIHVGQQVIAGKTVLGRIQRGEAHVHLTELWRGFPVNPATPGHLGPYSDSTTPQVTEISLRRAEGSVDELPSFVRRRVYLVAEASDAVEPIDTPGLRVPGIYRDWTAAPALVTWRIERWNGGVVVREQVARDARLRIPEDSEFWSTFARGTYQNQSVFGSHYSYQQPGRYLFKLTPRPFDTNRLADGVYDLVVTAADVAGHRGTKTLRFTVHNGPGWSGK
jgi:hypothetical protein